jgi:hypothetical protein
MHSHRGEHLNFGLAPERLRVDEQTVEVEDHRGDGSPGMGFC